MSSVRYVFRLTRAYRSSKKCANRDEINDHYYERNNDKSSLGERIPCDKAEQCSGDSMKRSYPMLNDPSERQPHETRQNPDGQRQ